MKKCNLNNQIDTIIIEFQDSEIELAKALLSLRKIPSNALKNRVRNIPYADPLITSSQFPAVSGKERRQLLPRITFNWQLALSSLSILILISIFAIPSAQARMNQMLQRFGIVLISSDESGEGALSSDQLSNTESINEEIVDSFNLEEVNNILSSSPPMPSWIPENIEFYDIKIGSGASTDLSNTPLVVIISYRPITGSSYPDLAGMGLQVTYESELEGGYSFPTDKIQNVTVNGQPAVFVKGGWISNDESSSTDVIDLEWSNDVDSGHLSWSRNGFIFNLTASDLNLTIDDFLRIAESIP